MKCMSLLELNLEFQTEISRINNVVSSAPFQCVPEAKTNLSEIFTEKKSPRPKKKQRGIFTIISNILFNLAILAILFTILTSGPSDGAPKMFMRYTYFTVLTSSMQDEIPKGSFILVKHVEPYELEIGDNITYMRDITTSVTHKIIDIYENYENKGIRGFQTKGVNNANPDKDIVYESSIIGKVIFILPKVGVAISYLNENIYIVFIIFGLCVILSFLVRGLFAKSEKKGYKHPR